MSLCRGLNAGELIVLSTAYRLAENEELSDRTNAARWIGAIANHSGLLHYDLVLVHEESLEKKKLITERTLADRSGVNLGDHFRVSKLVAAICRFIETYEPHSEPTE